MSISGISSTSAPQAAPVVHHHKKAESPQPESVQKAPANTGQAGGAASYHGVSGASGRIDIKV